jgi:hypothetical protein
MPFIAPAIAAISAALSSSAVVAFLTTNIVGRLLVSVAASALMTALSAPNSGPKSSQGGGISTTYTQSGALNPLSFVLGRYATGGTMVCPPMSHGTSGKTPNAYLTYVIALGCVAGPTLESVIINGEAVTLGSPTHADYGQSVQGRYLGYAWVKYYDGSQTAADAGLIAKYGSYPSRPWSSDMIGRGVPYAIVTFRYNPEIWNGPFPEVRFVMGGIPLYDIRKDSTAGGSGSHRWANRATWEPTVNCFVAIYNIQRGITLNEGSVWGGGIAANDLDLTSYVAAMNECDVAVRAATGTEAQFRFGFEVTVDRKPADVIAELLKASSGQVVENGGKWKARAGGPGMPVYFFTDGDVVVTKPQDFKPFPGLESSFNGINAAYPEPASLWESKPAPPRYNATYETEDQGRRRVASVDFPAVPYPDQVQRLMRAYIEEERRFRRHGLSLPPDAAILEPLDAVSWTSAENGYSSKVFEVSEFTDDLRTMIQHVALRERDPSDYSYPEGMFLPSVAGVPGVVVPAAQSVTSWAVNGISIPDATGAARRPGLQLSWDGVDQDDVTGVKWQVRVKATGVVVSTGSTHDVDNGSVPVSEGLLPATQYEARGRFVTDRSTTWSSWLTATTPPNYISATDFAGGTIPAVDLSGVLDVGRFATTVRPIEVLSTLPNTGNFQGRMVLLTTDSKLYRHTGSPTTSAGFTKATDGADIIANSIGVGILQAGVVRATELAVDSVVASKIAVSDFTNLVPDNALIDAASWSNAAFTLINPTNSTVALSKGELRWTTISTATDFSNGRNFAVKAGQEYWWQYQKGRTAGTQYRSYAQIQWFDKDGAAIGSAIALGSTTEILTGTTAVTRSGAVVAPAGAVEARWRWVVVGADTDSNARLWSPELRLKGTAELIVDGAIKANHIAANAITAGMIAANAITTSSMIVGGAVSRRVYGFDQLLSSVTTSDKTIVSKTFSAGKFNALVGPSGDRDNPVQINLDGFITILLTPPTGWVKITIYTQALISGVWTIISTDSWQIEAGHPGPYKFNAVYVIDATDIQDWAGFRVRIRRASGGGGTLDDAFATFMLTQISV